MISKRDGFFIITILILVMVLLFMYDHSKRVESALLYSASKTVKLWRDEAGRSNAELAVTKLDYATFKKVKGDLIDSLNKVSIRAKSVSHIITVIKETKDTIRVSVGKPFVSKWADFNILDSGRIAYSIRDSIALITHKKGYGFLNLKTKYVTRAVAFNPNTVLTGMQTIEIVPKHRRLSLGFFAGYGLQFSGGAIRVGPSFGVGLNCRIF